jgi:metal-responsive CopG/Arc/MetJ family transcriptional regulator
MKYSQSLPFDTQIEKKKSFLTLRVPTSLTNAVNTRCKDLDSSRSAFIQNALEKALETP